MDGVGSREGKMSKHTHRNRSRSGRQWVEEGERRWAEGGKTEEEAKQAKPPRLQNPFRLFCLAAESGPASLPWCVAMFILYFMESEITQQPDVAATFIRSSEL